MTSRKDIDQLIKRINETPGYVVPEVRTSSCHRRAYRADVDGNPIGRGVTLPGTPGDFNQLHITRRKLKRRLGWIDPIAASSRPKKRPDHVRTSPMPDTREAAKRVEFSGAETPPVEAPASPGRPAPAVSGRTVPDLTTSTIYQGARCMWDVIRDRAASNTDNATTHRGVQGWQWEGRLTDVAKEIWPPLAALEKKDLNYLVGRVRSVLTGSGRMVLIKAGNPVVQSVYFIRDQWEDTPTATAPAPSSAPAVDDTPQSDVTPDRAQEVNGKDAVAPGRPGDAPQNGTRRISANEVLEFLADADAAHRTLADIAALIEELATTLDHARDVSERLRARLRGSP